jgi:tetratricopeptide (TPR) repeat protein
MFISLMALHSGTPGAIAEPSMSLPHAVFLQRVAGEPATSPEVRLGQGAFLALRFVDLLASDREPPALDVFRYQWAATERYCSELSGEGTEAAHLSGIVNATGEAQRNGQIRLIAPALLAYALYLEQDAHLEEAEDVLETLVRVGGERLAASDAIAAWLRLGRVSRMQTAFERANAAYLEGGRLAQLRGDSTAVLLSRIGQCNVLYFRGNLAEAELSWRAVLADAERLGIRRAQAEAEHGLGTVLYRRGQSQQGAPHLWSAYELYEDDTSKLRALNDLGLLLLSVGDVRSAERALEEVVKRERVQDNLANAKIELLHCASFRRDRVGFERWRERVIPHLENAAPNVRADYHVKTGIGFARFGNYRRADDELRQALEIAVAHDLHEMTFRIERIRAGLQDCEALEYVEGNAAESFATTEAVREVSASLAALDD